MNKISAIIPAGGMGTRMSSDSLKQYLLINDKPIIVHAISLLENRKDIDEIIVVCPQGYEKEFENLLIKKYQLTKIKSIVTGGPRRQDSVKNGFLKISKDCSYVLIHDAVRPFVKQQHIDHLLIKAKKYGAAILGVKVKPTIKLVNKDHLVIKTLDRDMIFEIQTPQIFKKEILEKCYQDKNFENSLFTDEAAMVEKQGFQVAVVEGDYENIKITTKEDLLIAERIYHENRNRI